MLPNPPASYTAFRPMRLLRPGILANLSLAAFSVVLVLLALEGAARWEFHHRGGGKEENELARYTEPDPLLGWRKRPGAHVTYHRREYTTEVSINAHGLRGPDRAYQAPPGTFRVLALGDSFVEGYSVSQDETVTARLERLLTGPRCRVQVLNGGTAAYSTDQEYLFYREEGSRYSPQVVLLFLYYNDILANTIKMFWGASKPLLVDEGGVLVVSNYPVPAPHKHPTVDRAREPIHGSALWNWTKDRLATGAPRLFNRLARLGLWDPIGGEEVEVQMRVYKRRRRREIEAAWNATDRILRALEREAAARHARLALVYVPSRMEVSDRDWELTKLSYGLNGRWDRGLVARRVAQMARSEGVPLLDLTPALRASDRGILGEPYYVHDGHWNRLGHQVAARAVRDFLRDRGWLPACSPAVAAAD